jgi:hypothetical protein
MSDFPNPDALDQLRDFFEHEEFLAFFDLYLPGAQGRTLNGLCKVARPQSDTRERVNYICLTFIVDTPNSTDERQIETLIAKLNERSFKQHIPTLQTMTSVPTSDRHAENYIHQMDLIFQRNQSLEVRELIPMIMFTIRQATGLKAENPQWWDEEAVKPQPTAAEKANWGNRLKALLGAIKR